MRQLILRIVIVLLFLQTSIIGAQNKEKEMYDAFIYHNSKFNFDSSIHYVDLYINYHNENGTDSSIIEAYSHKIRILKYYKKHAEGLELTLNTYNTYCVQPDKPNNCINCNSIYSHLADFMVIIKDYRQGIKYLEMECVSFGITENNYHKAEIYCLLNFPDTALQLTQAYIVLASQENNPSLLVTSYNRHGLITKRLGMYDEAIKSFSTALIIVDSFNLDQTRYGYLLGNLGASYFEKKDYINAYKYLVQDANLSMKNNIIGSYINAETILCEIEVQRENYELAQKRIDNLLNNYDDLLFPTQKLALLELLMQVFKSKGNKIKHEYYLNQWIAVNKSNTEHRIETNQALTEEYAANSLRQVAMQMKIEKELLHQKIVSQQIEEDKKQLKNWLLVSVLIIMIMILSFSIWRNKKRVLLKEQQLKLAKSEQHLLALKIESESKNVKALSLELEVKKEFSTNLIHELSQLDNISKPELKNIELFVQNELKIKSVQVEIRNQMGDLSSSFYTDLNIEHPELTDMDLKLAAMITMNMSNKEISISKNITPASVKKTKTRLKKKMKLSYEDDLTIYLKAYVS